MNELFLKIVNMSISASWLVLAVLILRLLFKKAPKWLNVLLWGIVAIRLVCPFSFESIFSLIPSAETIPLDIEMNTAPVINSGIGPINNVINPIISGSNTPAPGASINPLQITVRVLEIFWILGTAAMLIYAFISYISLRAKVRTAVLYDGGIFLSENVASPFVLGLIKPKIYLPFNIDGIDIHHVIAHEKAHIQRRDHIWKPIGFFLLSLHWFNPLMWIAYILLCRDIELACDEKIIKDLNSEERASYTEALVSCSVNRRIIAACPLAFGEVGVKERVRSVLNYKKPAFWIIAAAVTVSIIVALCFLTNPKTDALNEKTADFIEAQILHHHSGKQAFGSFPCADFKVLETEKSGQSTTVYMWVLYREYSEENGQVVSVGGTHIPTAITFKDEDGVLSLVEYWEPRDGSYYEDDIRSKFPWYLRLTSLNSQKYIEEQTASCLEIAKAHFAANQNTGSLRGFRPVELVYDDLSYSYVPSAEIAPIYLIQNGRQLLESYDGKNSSAIGVLRQMELTPDNFDHRFRSGMDGWLSDDTPESIKENNKYSWQLYCDTTDERSPMYIILEQADGTFYLGYGYYDDSSSHVRWLYKLGEILVPGTDPNTNDMPIYSGGSLAQVPDMAVICGKESVYALKSMSQWTWTGEDGKAVSICADPVHPLMLKDQMPRINILPTYMSRVNPLEATVIFSTHELSPPCEVPPDRVSVICWSTDKWGQPHAEYESIETRLEGTYWSFKLKNGEYIYQVVAEWSGYEEFSGTAMYCFCAVSNLLELNDLPLLQHPAGSDVYNVTPTELHESALQNEQFTITKFHYKTADEQWFCEHHLYKYRLEISGAMPNSETNATFIILSNRNDISFEKALLASGISSNINDYFTPDDAVIVALRLFKSSR